jgi:hypothetical protein
MNYKSWYEIEIKNNNGHRIFPDTLEDLSWSIMNSGRGWNTPNFFRANPKIIPVPNKRKSKKVAKYEKEHKRIIIFRNNFGEIIGWDNVNNYYELMLTGKLKHLIITKDWILSVKDLYKYYFKQHNDIGEMINFLTGEYKCDIPVQQDPIIISF